MYRFQYKKNWIKKAMAAGVVCVLLLLIIILTLIRPQYNKAKNLSQEYSTARKQLNDLNRITESIIEYREKQEEAEDIAAEFLSYVVSVGTSTKKIKTCAAELSDNSEVIIDEINRGTTYFVDSVYKKQLWNVSFKVGFQGLLDFVKNVESSGNFLGIENFQIESAERGKKHAVNMGIYNVVDINPESVPAYDMTAGEKSLLTLPETAVESIEKLISLSEYRHIDTSVDKDPLYYGDTLFKDSPVQRPQRRAAPSPPRLQLDGILWDEDDPSAVINGVIKKEGEDIKGTTVERITRDHVLVKWRTRYIKLQIELD